LQVAIELTFIEQHKAELSLRNLKKQPVEDASDEYRLTQLGPSQLKLEKKLSRYLPNRAICVVKDTCHYQLDCSILINTLLQDVE